MKTLIDLFTYVSIYLCVESEREMVNDLEEGAKGN